MYLGTEKVRMAVYYTFLHERVDVEFYPLLPEGDVPDVGLKITYELGYPVQDFDDIWSIK